ncbi:MAG TPA: class II aldolase/adducin family protein, partial [Kofleriaceae bacterium]
MRLRDELVSTAKRMSGLGLTPGMSGNVSVRSPIGMLVTPSGLPYDGMIADDVVEMKMDGTIRPGQKTPTTEWQLHRDILGSRQDIQAIVHTHSLFCTTLSMLRREIPAVHYMVVLSGSDAIPCAEYATFGSAKLALNAVEALGGGNACLLANHGMVALGSTLAGALRLA